METEQESERKVGFESEKLLEMKNFSVHFKTLDGNVQALDDVNLSLSDGEILGIIGESGSGKSTTGLALMNLLAENAITTGEVKFLDEDIISSPDTTVGKNVNKRAIRRARKITTDRLLEIRWKEMSMIFQGAMNSFNPVHTIRNQIIEVFDIHNIFLKKIEKDGKVQYIEDEGLINSHEELIDEGNLRYNAYQMALDRINDPDSTEFTEMEKRIYNEIKRDIESKISEMSSRDKKKLIIKNRIESSCRKAGFNIKFLDSYPHELSGGMRQRGIIAMALALNPKVVIADEPTTGLDVITQAKIIKELKNLKDKKTVNSMVVISHDVGVVSQLANYVAVMYAGRIMEYGEPKDIFVNPKNPYTYALMRSYPSIDSTKKRIHGIPGSVPDLLHPPSGCFFASRCFMAEEICFKEKPELKILSEDHKSLCHFDTISTEKYEKSQAYSNELMIEDENTDKELVMEIRDLKKYFSVHSSLTTNLFGGANKPVVHAVDGINLRINKRTILGVVGESGSGKTTLGKLLVDAIDPTQGQIMYRFPMSENEKVQFSGENGKPPQSQLDQPSQPDGEKEGVNNAIVSVDNEGIGDGYLLIDIHRLSKFSNRYSTFRKESQLIFQDPYDSINPKMSIFDIVAEPLTIQKKDILTRRAAIRANQEIARIDEEALEKEDGLIDENTSQDIPKGQKMDDALRSLEEDQSLFEDDSFDLQKEVVDALETSNLRPAQNYLDRYPHELSGGERQRVSIARAITLGPSFIVADEPISMLDVSIRANVMNLLLKLKEDRDISILYISHDIASARYVSDFIVVMYLGQLVEFAKSEDIIKSPMHPYTKALISAVPSIDPEWVNKQLGIVGEIGSAVNPKKGCRFYGRCIFHKDICKEEDPDYIKIGERYYKCHFQQEELTVEESMLNMEKREE